MTLSTTRKFASTLLSIAAVAGFALVLVVAHHHPRQAGPLLGCAIVWLLACGASKLVFDLTEAAARGPAPTSGGAERHTLAIRMRTA